MTSRGQLLESYRPLCKSLAKLLPGLVEVVLHDLTTGNIAYIENPFTSRKIGDQSLVETENYAYELDTDKTIGPYTKSNPDGSKLKSVSSLISDEHDRPVGLLCINMKVNALESVMQLCQDLISVEEADNRTILKNDWREATNSIIADTLASRKITAAQAKRDDRMDIVRRLHDADVLSARGSADYIAEALGISRAGLYQLLRVIRNSTSNSLPQNEHQNG